MKKLLLAAVLAFAPAALCAQPVSPQAAQVIAAIDTNGDGKVDIAEYLALRRAAMARANRDGEPGLTLDEFRASLDPSARTSAQSAFTGFDRDGSGVLDDTEATGYHSFVFANVLDGDRDGFWTPQELEMFLASNPQALGQGATQGGAAAQSGPPDPETVIALLDADGNGTVNLNEYLTFQVTRFAQFDADGSGEMTLREFQSSLEGVARSRASTSVRTFDADRDGRLAQREFLGYHAYVYNSILDTNGDHEWSVEEYRRVLGRR